MTDWRVMDRIADCPAEVAGDVPMVRGGTARVMAALER
jgi:hypothetical protein